jgi:2-polyprenyl-3-methyl-5-hydroxy-6-metoxy-1,4-benzoquinol methylase
MDKCIVCGGGEHRIVSETARYRVPVKNVICARCGLVSIPDPDTESLARFYEKGYRQQYKAMDLNSMDYRFMKQGKAKLISARIARGASVLDVGCANGVLLAELSKLRPDLRCRGIEPDRELSKQAAAKGFETFCGRLEEYAAPEKFDFVILDHVLEHFPRPDRALEKVGALLSPGGEVYLEVPNIRDPYGDFDLNFLQHAHLYNFTPRTLRLLLKVSGFIDEVAYIGNGCIGTLVRKDRQWSRDEIDFAKEGDDPGLLLKFFDMYRNRHRANSFAGSRRQADFLNAVRTRDLELEEKMVCMRMKTLRDLCLSKVDEDAYGEALKCLNDFYRTICITPVEAVEMLVLGKKLAEKKEDPALAAGFGKLLDRVRDIVSKDKEEACV